MHVQRLFLLAPLLLRPAVAIPRPQDASPPDTPAASPKTQGAWIGLSTALGGAGLLAAGRSWHLNRQMQKQLAQDNKELRASLLELRNEMIGRETNLWANFRVAQQKLGVHELRRYTRQGMHDLHQRLDGSAGASDGHPTSETEQPFNLAQLSVELRALDLVLRQNPELWLCATTWLEGRHAIREDGFVEVVDWNEAADQCDRDKRYRKLRLTHATLGRFMPLPEQPPLNENRLASLTHVPAQLHSAVQRSMKTLAKSHLGAALWKTEKNLGREEVQAIRLGV
ncbi:MAG: hypothetical protein M1826_002589 [Phylliscum demangeonii]|nr:MAG: hypothetical protein M1826_002589 [Phylliscum demangeonii]